MLICDLKLKERDHLLYKVGKSLLITKGLMGKWGIHITKHNNLEISFTFFYNQNDTIFNGNASDAMFWQSNVHKICPPTSVALKLYIKRSYSRNRSGDKHISLCQAFSPYFDGI